MIKYAILAALATLSLPQVFAQGQPILPNESIINSTPDTLYVMNIYKAAEQAVKIARYDSTITHLREAFAQQKGTYQKLKRNNRNLQTNLTETIALYEAKEESQRRLIDLHKATAKTYRRNSYILAGCSFLLLLAFIIK